MEDQLRSIDRQLGLLVESKKGVVEQYAKGILDRIKYSDQCREIDEKAASLKKNREALLTQSSLLSTGSTVDADLGESAGPSKACSVLVGSIALT